ncbi:MAG TPA: dephospho-CoA kinase [Acidimicrobiia bacterium]
MGRHGTRFLIGGGIGSGKSAAAACFAALGAVILSSDAIGHAVLEPGTPQADEVAVRWPEVVVAGRIDRRLLGRLVFANPSQLAELEALTHPEITRRLTTLADAVPDDLVMVELPVLRDLPGRGWPWVVVDAPDDLRIARTVARGAMSAAEVRRVMDRQAGRGEWLAAASWVVDNSGDPGLLLGQCRRVWDVISQI